MDESKQQSEKIEYGKEHDWRKLSLVLSSIVSFIIAVGFNLLASAFYSPTAKLFMTTTGNISDKFPTDFTPAGWTFSIWGVIYAWQALLLLYSFVCIFRRTKDGYYLYLRPDFLHYGIFILYTINWWTNIIWIFLWGNEHLGWALLFICLLTFTLYLALFISHRKLYQNTKFMRENGLKVDVWLVRIFIQNGIACYATWVSIASNLNFAIYIIHRLGSDKANAGTAALFLTLGAIINYFILENFVWRKYLRYTFSPWFVMIVAVNGILNKNWNYSSPTRNNIIALIVIIIVALLFITRIVLFWLYRTVLKERFHGSLFKRNNQIETNGKPLVNGHSNGTA